MSTTQPFLTTAQGTRRFACSAVAVQAIIVHADERVLLLSSPTQEARCSRAMTCGTRATGGPSRS
jgi:hypothetical protein